MRISGPAERFVPCVTVLAYHNIVAAGQESPQDIYSLSIERLNEHAVALRKAGFVQLPLSVAFDVLVGPRDHAPGFVLTFDDGYASLLRYAPDIPSEAAPTVFILTRCAGTSTYTWNTRSSVVLDHLDLDGIRDLGRRGFDIQLHGTDHHNLLKFDDDHLRDRFQEAGDWFHRNLGRSPDYLAYPYGCTNKRVQAVVSEFFSGAVSISHGAWLGPEARYALNRLEIPNYLTGSDVVALLRTLPATRWAEIERRAPWRKADHG